ARNEWVRFARDLNSARQLAALAAAVAAALLLFFGVRVLAMPFPFLVASLALFARMAAPAQALQQSAQHLAAYAPSFVAIERRLGPLAAARIDGRTLRALDCAGRCAAKKRSYLRWTGMSCGSTRPHSLTRADLAFGRFR